MFGFLIRGFQSLVFVAIDAFVVTFAAIVVFFVGEFVGAFVVVSIVAFAVVVVVAVVVAVVAFATAFVFVAFAALIDVVVAGEAFVVAP
mmetsp:Transcript_117863/g.176076  ORF Transcript_117863/g.176076 Transcript_117863/m.176076 type:complete len:89 (+) Transcript_117863:650-916(+)